MTTHISTHLHPVKLAGATSAPTFPTDEQAATYVNRDRVNYGMMQIMLYNGGGVEISLVDPSGARECMGQYNTHRTHDDNSTARARRLAATWNACAGVSNDMLERLSADRPMLRSKMEECDTLREMLHKAEAERDHLREQLRLAEARATASAPRIAAALNACDGVDTEMLQRIYASGGMLLDKMNECDALRSLLSAANTLVATITAERDQQRAALDNAKGHAANLTDALGYSRIYSSQLQSLLADAHILLAESGSTTLAHARRVIAFLDAAPPLLPEDRRAAELARAHVSDPVPVPRGEGL